MSLTTDQEKITPAAIGFLEKAKWPVFIIVFVLLSFFAIRNFVFLSQDMITGDYSALRLVPAPLYPLRRIPNNPVTEKYRAVKHLGADFAQIYFPAQAMSSLGDAYIAHESPDPWGRPSRYAPFILGLCSITICRLDYGPASFANILIQILLFVPALFFLLRSFGIRKYFLPSLLLTEFILFLTPVGLSWIERGQFTLYLAVSCLLLLLGLVRKNARWVFVSACLAFIKWTSLPLAFVILAIYILNSKNAREAWFGMEMASLFGLVFIVLLLPFFKVGIDFVKGLLSQELLDNPEGLSLLEFAPRFAVKLIPFLTIVLGYINIRFAKNDFIALMPYFTGAAILFLLYPTRAYEYGLPSLLGSLPLMLYWNFQLGTNRRMMGNILAASFILFLVAASFSSALTHSDLVGVVIYLVFSLGFIASPSLIAKYAPAAV